MDVKAEVDRARRRVEAAKQEHAIATEALLKALTDYGILIGVYNGLSALEARHGLFKDVPDRATDPADGDDTGTEVGERRRAKKGYGKRQTESIVEQHGPSGISKEQISVHAARTGEPISDGTLRRALRDLKEEGRITQTGDLYFSAAVDAEDLVEEAVDAPQERESTASFVFQTRRPAMDPP